MREFMLDKNPDMANPAIKIVNAFDAVIARTARRSPRLTRTGRGASPKAMESMLAPTTLA